MYPRVEIRTRLHMLKPHIKNRNFESPKFNDSISHNFGFLRTL